MKKSILGIALLCSFLFASAQVGIDTTAPYSTLHVREKRDTGNTNTTTAKDGIIPPSLTKKELSLKTSGTYSSLQNGAMVFVTDVSLATNSADPSFSQVSNIDSAGYYYYSATANKWIKLTPTASVQDLRMLTNNNHVTQDAGFGSNGTSLGTGTDNIAIGKDGQKSITTGTRNISIGTNVLSSNTTGSSAIGIGYNALSKATATNGTTAPIAIGESALQNLTSGESMLAIGNNALSTITNGGNYSIAIGSNALAANNNSWNTAIGINSLQSATGSGNSAFGYRTGNTMTTGVNNTYIGASTAVFLKSSVDHNQNTFVGSQITQNTSGTTPGFDVKYDGVSALGATSLQKLPTTLNAISQSTFLGTNATVAPSYTETSLNFGTAIGAQAKVGASNSIVLGRIPNSTLDNNGIPTNNPQDNVGIGVIAPTNPLHVKSAADPVKIEGLQAETGTTNNVLVVDGTGVIKTASRSGMSGGTITATNGLNKSVNDIQLGGPLTKSTSIVQGPNSLSFTSTVTNAFSVDGSTLSVDAANDRVGVGTITPSSTLEAKGSIEGNFSEMTGASYNLTASDYHVSFSGAANSVLNLPTTQSTTDNTAGDFRGRKYYIKNNSTTSSLTITAQGTQTIRYGGSKTASATYVLDAGSYAMITASGSGWDLDIVGSAAKASNWFLFDTALNYKKNQSQVISSFTPTYTNIDGGSVTVNVPNGYAQNKIVINFTGWGHSTTDAPARGSLRFQIVQTQTGQPSVTYTSVMMSSWSTMAETKLGIRFNYPVVYTIDNLAPGTYTFALQVAREDETGALSGTTPVLNWGVQSKADVYVKP